VETPEGLKERVKNGTSVDLELKDEEGVSLTAFAPLEVGGAGRAKVEVDTGSDNLILHSRCMSALGIEPNDKAVKVVRASDETGHPFVRYFTDIAGWAALGGFPTLRQTRPRVMFQDIIHDGLIGDDFLKHYVVTYDLPHSRLILQPLRP
jgi:hypothetical protein